MRYRELTNVTQTSMLHQFMNGYNSDGSNYEILNSYDLQTSNSQNGFMHDVVTPGFKKLVAQGHIVNNPMVRVYQTYSSTVGRFRWEDHSTAFNAVRWNIHEFVIPDASPGLSTFNYEELMAWSVDESNRDVAVAAAWADIDISEYAALASLGELPETLNWLKDVYVRCHRILRMFLARRIRMRLRAKDLSDWWLELRYAVRPLFFEAEQIQNLLLAERPPERLTARGYNQGSIPDSAVNYSDISFTPNVAATFHIPISGTISSQTNYRAGVLYHIADDINFMAHALGLNRPLSAVWELTPFSFIMDWFFNIGEIIASWTVPCSFTPLSSWVTEEIVVTVNAESAAPIAGWVQSNGWSGFTESTRASATSKAVLKRRIISPDRPILPSLSINLDAAKLLDLALIGKNLFRAM